MANYITYNPKEGELTGGGPRKKKKRSVFIAYSFTGNDGPQFRLDIEAHINASPSLQSINVVDGHLPIGDHWASKIRERLSASSLVIADFSTVSPEVTFECGFAYGLNKPILPVVNTFDNIGRLPRWLTALECGCYMDGSGWTKILDSISEQLQRKSNTRSMPKPNVGVPYSAVLYGSGPGFQRLEEELKGSASRYGFDSRAIQKNEEINIADEEDELATAICSASFLICMLDGGSSDTLAHFAAGALVAQPSSGVAKNKLNRKALMVLDQDMDHSILVADSARRSVRHVQVMAIDKVLESLHAFGNKFKSWKSKNKSID